VSRLLSGLVLVATPLIGACGAAPGRCEAVIWGAGQTALEQGATIPPGLEQLVGPEDIDWSASSLKPGNPPVLQLSLRPEAAERIADHTRENAGSFLAVALNGQVVSAPMIMSGIEGGVIQLEGTQPIEFAAFAPCFGR
jgi:preprotein translocase subunit SecD